MIAIFARNNELEGDLPRSYSCSIVPGAADAEHALRIN
jgi:hypothetical protein